MAFSHAPLEASVLGPVAGKFVGEGAPPKMRKMVAAGLAPLPPREMLVGLYQIWAANDEDSDTAAKTLEGLPKAVLDGALADAKLPAGVLDLLGRKFGRKVEVLTAVVRHPAVDDETLIGIARVCPEKVCDVIADNQVRWLQAPMIVSSLYGNRYCRMSVIHRMIEFAEREGVDLPLPAMEEIRAVLADSGPPDESRDDMFKKVHGSEEATAKQDKLVDLLAESEVDDDLDLALPDLDGDDEAEEEAEAEAEPVAPAASADAGDEESVEESKKSRMAEIQQMRPLEKIRTALLGDKYDRSLLVRDSNKAVAMATIRSPKVRDDEAVNFSSNRALSADVITYIANRREWVKLYTIKLNLIMNPKTPLAKSMTLLAYLNRNDVQKVARSRGIPSALSTAAKRKMQQRR